MTRRILPVLVLVIVSFVLGACQSASQGGPTDPAAVMDAYTAAINAGDIEAAMALVADDAVYERAAGNFNGKEEIRGFVEGLIAREAQVELVGERQVDGEIVSW